MQAAPPTPTMTPPALPGREQTLAEHLEELRRRLGISLAALLIAVGIAWTQVDRIVEWVQQPAAGRLAHFAYFSPAEPLVAYLKVSVLAGLLLAMPVILWQVWGFIRTGLTPKERIWGQLLVGWGSLQFAAGVAFAYLVLLPLSLHMLLAIGEGRLIPVISIDRYLSFVTSMAFWCGLAFELPVVLYVLSRVGIVTAEWLRQQRAYAVLALVIIAAVVTPTTDPVSLLLMAVPLIVLYEISILVTRLGAGRR